MWKKMTLQVNVYYYLGTSYLTIVLCPATLSMATYLGQTPQSHPNPGNSLILSLSVSRSRRDASFLHWLSSHRAVSRSPVAAPRTMPCLLLPAPPPRSCLIASVRRSPHRKDRFLRPRTRRRPRLWRCVSMTEMARVGSGGESAEVGVPVESDPMLRGEESPGPRREASRWAPVEATLNRMHDAEIIWILLGAVSNSLLSTVLKKMLNHERPSSALRSDPGMPSSHAQSIFYAATILVLSLYYWTGANYMTVILGPATLSVATYLSWLRVSQRLHTLNQVMVGAAVGSTFGALWFMLWHSLVQEAFASSMLVRIAVILGSAIFCVGFVIYMIRHWLKDE
ncbi:hypothetical protein HU200_017699 [Digitaria exilis]|uniref:Phosphatidic acid phosphatase type 2/haloperoxidase domain-containing protein n=1 Tax=Digitaria exilis TaxID=1010633 RepID=A0A835KK03_9POAL|nr:hypothetical protein HU200_017699 [Digitaria exilis]